MTDDHDKPKPPPITPVKSYHLTPEEIAALRAEARGNSIEPPKSYRSTPEEIANIRAEAKTHAKYFRKAFADMRPRADGEEK
jgi:hypothetical protein